jgi:hypothetical protein
MVSCQPGRGTSVPKHFSTPQQLAAIVYSPSACVCTALDMAPTRPPPGNHKRRLRTVPLLTSSPDSSQFYSGLSAVPAVASASQAKAKFVKRSQTRDGGVPRTGADSDDEPAFDCDDTFERAVGLPALPRRRRREEDLWQAARPGLVDQTLQFGAARQEAVASRLEARLAELNVHGSCDWCQISAAPVIIVTLEAAALDKVPFRTCPGCVLQLSQYAT